MNKEKILLIFQTKSRADYWFSWFRNNYQNYITLIKGTTKETYLKNGTVLYFKTLEDNLRGLRYDKEFNGERLELLCLKYENNQLKEQRQELRTWLEKQVFNRGGSSIDLAIEIHTFCKVLDKLNELEGGNNE